jgi:hypothetical protein
VQEVTDVGDDLLRVRGGEPMSVVDPRGRMQPSSAPWSCRRGIAIGR